MAGETRHIPRPIKRRLIDEAGGKCANPGCPNTKVQFHHIKHWAVYKAHNSEDMIAICPSCHDAAHHGKLKIPDETLFRWKGAFPLTGVVSDVLFVEPATEVGLLAGTIVLSTTNQSLIAFELSNLNTLAFRLEDGDIMLVRARLRDLTGQEVLRVSDNRVRVCRDKDVSFERRPGRVRIEMPSTDRYVYPLMIKQMRVVEPNYATDRITALDLEVWKPGLVKVRGVWAAAEGGVVITDQRFALMRPGFREPISLVGHGEGTILKFAGPVTMAMFKFA
ncbi:hypothetical protein AB7M16_002872 [Bradyrhizobium sp. USDA 372]